MKKRTVITNIPIRLPIQSTILYSFLLYYFHVDGLWWGVFITLYSILWIIVIVVKFSEEHLNLDDDTMPTPRRKFIEKLNALLNNRTS